MASCMTSEDHVREAGLQRTAAVAPGVCDISGTMSHPPRGNQDLVPGQDAHYHSMGTYGAR
jgi:hypothetical protein